MKKTTTNNLGKWDLKILGIFVFDSTLTIVCPKISRHLCSTFGRFLIKKTHIHVPVKFVQEKYPNHLRLHIVIFHSEKITSTKTDFLQRYIMENVYISPPFGNHAEYLAQFYSVIIGVLWFLSQCKIPVDFFFNF